MYTGLHMKYLLFLFYFNQILIFLRYFSTNLIIQSCLENKVSNILMPRMLSHLCYMYDTWVADGMYQDLYIVVMDI